MFIAWEETSGHKTLHEKSWIRILRTLLSSSSLFLLWDGYGEILRNLIFFVCCHKPMDFLKRIWTVVLVQIKTSVCRGPLVLFPTWESYSKRRCGGPDRLGLLANRLSDEGGPTPTTTNPMIKGKEKEKEEEKRNWREEISINLSYWISYEYLIIWYESG